MNPTRAAVLEPGAELVLSAVLECIHPSDKLGPGAAELGLPAYVLGELEGPLSRFLPAYTAGLRLLDELALAETSSAFVDLGPEAQESLLSRV